MSKRDHDFCCLSCLHSFRIKSKLKRNKKVYENKYFRGNIMPAEDNRIVEFIQTRNLMRHHLLFMQIWHL